LNFIDVCVLFDGSCFQMVKAATLQQPNDEKKRHHVESTQTHAVPQFTLAGSVAQIQSSFYHDYYDGFHRQCHSPGDIMQQRALQTLSAHCTGYAVNRRQARAATAGIACQRC
jgi:hypothetical protein